MHTAHNASMTDRRRMEIENLNNIISPAVPVFTSEQYKQILKLLSKENEPTEIANMAGISNTTQNYWIIDSGASNHMASSLNLLLNPKSVPNNQPNCLQLPNGNNTKITHTRYRPTPKARAAEGGSAVFKDPPPPHRFYLLQQNPSAVLQPNTNDPPDRLLHWKSSKRYTHKEAAVTPKQPHQFCFFFNHIRRYNRGETEEGTEKGNEGNWTEGYGK
ncbi:hypothetical protein A4A49_28023 [Nicotiana attenuata]|uniref:Uncharacterized protein n=1 Tax=Nicotiana attenuata TaxID=49451 RepID=A0A1J6ICE2_NICAT|nr:hypothetical protein A4A49_28023 [Nicotiana attenuata]